MEEGGGERSEEESGEGRRGEEGRGIRQERRSEEEKIMKGRGRMEGIEGKREGRRKEGGRRTDSRGEGSTGQRAYKYVGDLQSCIKC